MNNLHILGHNLIFDIEWPATIRYHCNTCKIIIWQLKSNGEYRHIVSTELIAKKLITCNEIIIKRLLE